MALQFNNKYNRNKKIKTIMSKVQQAKQISLTTGKVYGVFKSTNVARKKVDI